MKTILVYIAAILFMIMIILHIVYIGTIDDQNFLVSICFGGGLIIADIIFVRIVKNG